MDEKVGRCGEGRAQDSLDAFCNGMMAEQMTGVEAIAMAMWKPYVQSTLAHGDWGCWQDRA